MERRMTPLITGAALIGALFVAALAVHLVLTWMDRRGWVWYRNKNRPRPSSLGLIEELYQPSIEHVANEHTREETEADQVESGEPVDPATDP